MGFGLGLSFKERTSFLKKRSKKLLQIGAALVRPAGRVLGRKHMYGVVLAALTAQFLGKK